ncbi:hypothetical protein [Enterococcus thailandicus]|uniref:Uncharacterized protein n=1 Tax=Enterococcus thailandicus TaxID=417368 RepID=A0A179ERT7_ENTTH|nr:hypothetical protein [Enterococcus thailandicus]OAQ55966.1 hypothetical protein A6E74_04410 [Enterococcus thailandicus]
MDFQRSHPKLANFLTDHVSVTRKEQRQSRWHWATLILFGLLTIASFSQQLLLLTGLVILVALFREPGLILWSIVYSFLVSLFPPLGIILSAIFFLLNIGTFTKNWRVTLVGIYFYLYPVFVMSLRYFKWDNQWFLAGSLIIGLCLLHLMLRSLYQRYGIGRTISWYIFAIPFTVLSALLPTRLKKRLKRFPSLK